MIYGRPSNTFQFEEDIFSKKAEAITETFHEVIILYKILETKPRFETTKKSKYNLFHTVFKSRNGKEDNIEEDDFNNSDSLYDKYY